MLYTLLHVLQTEGKTWNEFYFPSVCHDISMFISESLDGISTSGPPEISVN